MPGFLRIRVWEEGDPTGKLQTPNSKHQGNSKLQKFIDSCRVFEGSEFGEKTTCVGQVVPIGLAVNGQEVGFLVGSFDQNAGKVE